MMMASYDKTVLVLLAGGVASGPAFSVRGGM
jgi:hypothetical protein